MCGRNLVMNAAAITLSGGILSTACGFPTITGPADLTARTPRATAWCGAQRTVMKELQE